MKKGVTGGKPTYSQVFGDWLCDMAVRDPRLVAITPAMREGSGMVAYSERFPERYFDVGIAEQHAVTFAAGLACEGMKPVVAIYSTFLQRGYDQLIHDVAIQNLPVLFALDRGGLVGGDGATHNGAFDYAYLRTVPNLTVMAPSDAAECRNMLFTGIQPERARRGALSARRRARRRGAGDERHHRRQGGNPARGQARGDPRLRRDAQARARGGRSPRRHRGQHALRQAAGRRSWSSELARTHELLVTVEEHQVMGGAGLRGLRSSRQQRKTKVLLLGLPDRFIDHGDPGRLLASVGLDADGIQKSITAT